MNIILSDRFISLSVIVEVPGSSLFVGLTQEASLILFFDVSEFNETPELEVRPTDSNTRLFMFLITVRLCFMCTCGGMSLDKINSL